MLHVFSVGNAKTGSAPSQSARRWNVNGSRKRFTAYDTQSYHFIVVAERWLALVVIGDVP